MRGIIAALPFTAYAVCGLLAVLVQPHNRVAQLLLGVGVLLPAARTLEEVRDDAGGRLGNVELVVWGRDAAFLLGLACLVAVLSRFPDGRHRHRGERLTERVVAVAAVLSAAGLLAGGPVATVAEAVAGTEPLWALAAVGLLVRRYRRSPELERRQVRWPLRALMVLAAVLIVALVAPGDPSWTGPLFLAVLALFPMSLVAGVTARARQTEAELLLSRARLVTAEDEARRRIERDLHDGAQQQVVGVLSLLQLAQRQHGRGDGQTGSTLEQAVLATRQTMAELRELGAGIHPSVLSDCGLADAVDTRLSLLPFSATLASRLGDRRWPPATEAAAYFLVCEALTNAAKHASCDRVRVELADDHGALRVGVVDDGDGFDPRAADLRGLTGLRDRVEALGGRFELSSAAGAGTRLTAVFPA